MKLAGPFSYHVSIEAGPGGKLFQIKDVTPKFSKPATSNQPKLYIVAVEKAPIYVGITKQSMRTRLRLGFTADGLHGYHGYPWRDEHEEVALDLWCDSDPDPDKKKSMRDIETVEAEIVFLIRQMGQWPLEQTEIHFHPSTQDHRDAARTILNHYSELASG
jgi:hypothetical protein